MYTCKICNKNISEKGFGSHLVSHKISAKDYYDKYLKQTDEGICPICGKETPFIKISKGYQKFCSVSCSQKDPEVKAKIIATRIRKYDVENFFQNKDIQRRAEKLANSDDALEKKRQTCLKNYGTDNPAKSVTIQQKIQKTNSDRYGSKAYNRTKGKQTMKEKYGYEYALQVPEIKRKQENTEAFKWETYAKEHDYLLVHDLLKLYGSGWYQSKLGKEIVFCEGQQAFIKSSDLYKIINYIEQYGSHFELNVVNYVKSIYNGTVIRRTRSIISPLELDIYIPDKHLAIECNGNYWHSDANGTPKMYHFNKSKMCADLGIRLIHIYEWEWIKYPEKIKQLLNIALGSVNRIYARQCEVRLISNQDAKLFNDATHLQGHRNAQVTYGLFYNNELVQLMSFSKTRYNRNLKNDNEWEIIRGCPGSNNIVVGGVSKLFKHFINDYKPTKVFSYCDFNKFDGKSYLALGMKFIGYTGPNKWWFIDGTAVERNPKKYKEFKGNNIIWGSGSMKFEWTNNNYS